LRLDHIELVPEEKAGHPLFIATDGRGNRLFTISHLHVTLEAGAGNMSVTNAEVEASAYLARQLGFSEMAGMPVALGRLDLGLSIPAGAKLTGTPPGCSERPIWPQAGQFEVDVTLTGMNNIVYQGSHPDDGRIKLAPSASLKNSSQADVPWIVQFNSLTSYPYTPADQHPFLVWNLYRIADGRIEMLAGSGAKHAFFTINVNCNSCGGNNVLWAQCEDIYSAGSNDMSQYQGPRSEVKASLGEWEHCGSFFDPGCTGSQTGYAGDWHHRLLVDPTELQQPDAHYFMEAWYVIQYDVDIWNTMGFRPINPVPSASGWLMNPGPFSQGPAISQWVAENNGDVLADHAVITIPSATPGAPYPENMPQGHLRLLVRVREVAPGLYRYNYALQNYDFDRGLKAFRIGLTQNASVHDSFFGDVDADSDNDWFFSVDSGVASFDAPPDNHLGWFSLFNFEIETDARPVTSTVTLDLGGDAVQPAIEVTTIGPSGAIDLIFGDRFTP
ncbi:MAG TPA: hypothetical protein VK972_03635, partial [Wenzhouxiangella sp.]|nr:hypothetical protein [Wenzhouxiangella sp.]